MKMKVFTYLVCFAVVGSFSSASFANTMFDDFNAPDNSGFGQFPGGSANVPVGDYPDTAERSFSVTGGTGTINSPSGGGAASQLRVVGFGGSFSVVWTFDSPPFTFIDPAAGDKSFLFTGVSFTGAAPLPVSITLTDTDADTATVTRTINTGTINGTFEYFLSEFTADNSDIDINSLTSVSLGSTSLNGNLSADALVVTPEPSGLILAGLAVIALFGFSYFRKQQTVAVEA